jgi:deferrochelatase/peroxidase EfeB
MSKPVGIIGKGATRRGFLAAAGGAVAATGLGGVSVANPEAVPTVSVGVGIEKFHGAHQGGIVTPPQSHTYVAAFDIAATKRNDIADLLRRWTTAAAKMTEGMTAEPLGADLTVPATDGGDGLDLPPKRLTVTFGFGPGLFVKDGKDRFGLSAKRPEAFVDLPKFTGDQLVEEHTGGDLVVQACADDPQVVFHAIRQLTRLAYDIANIRWVQTGFVGGYGPKTTPRNLMGFKDGTANISTSDVKAMNDYVWVGTEGPDWMRGGSYVVIRRARMALEHWDRMNVAFQEQTFGRQKYSGAPLGMKHEFDQANVDAVDKDGNPVFPENCHVRLATASTNGGTKILRRGYSYNDGVNFTAERWPPWRQGMEYDAGLVFIGYQRDPRTGFINIFKKMSKFDMMNQFVTHVGGGMFACPGGVATGEFIGQRLFDAA